MRFCNLFRAAFSRKIHTVGLVLLALPTQAQISFDTPLSINAGKSPAAIVTGDFNGDGKLDLASTDQFSARAYVFLNRGSQPPTTQQIRVGQIPLALATADVDQDQDLDLVIANSGGSRSISVLINGGQGNFAAAQNYLAGSRPSSIVLGDFDQDGDVDAAVTNIGPNTVSILNNNGDGTFAAPQTLAVGAVPVAIAAGDLNADGFLDLVVANSGGNTLLIRLNQGLGRFAPPISLDMPNSPQGVALGDLDNDGDLDIVASNAYPPFGGRPSTAVVFKNNGSASFGAPQSYPVASYPSGVALGDLDGDGDLEIVVANKGVNIPEIGTNIPGTITVLGNRGDGTFLAQSTIIGIGYYTQPTGIVLGDLDGDGDLDVASANAGYFGLFTVPGKLSVVLNTTP